MMPQAALSTAQAYDCPQARPETLSILAIDPGIHGAWAIVSNTDLLVGDLPIHRVGLVGKKSQREELDLHAFHHVLVQHQISHAVIEQVGPMPQQGITSMFRLGYAAGSLYGVLIACGLPISFVTPQQWQRYHRIGGGADAARHRATQLYPRLAPMLGRKRDCHRADALLIGVFGRHRLHMHQATPFEAVAAVTEMNASMDGGVRYTEPTE